jgi:sigma-B regulation protein RsbU (phosphoserine phosphatase)
MMTRVNGEIAESNPERMFATVWIGVLDLRTGVVDFVNAGHNPPLLIRGDGTREYVTERHGPFLGPVPGVEYKIGALSMEPGDRLVVYSDGVTEAMNPEQELYGEDRFAALELADDTEAAPQFVVDEVLRWEAGSKRSDDVTVLVLDFVTQRETHTFMHHVVGDDPLHEIPKVNAEVARFGEDAALGPTVVAQVQLVLDEVVTNVLTYSGAEDLMIDLRVEPQRLTLVVSDNGEPFDPLTVPEPDTSLPLQERQIGGLGIHLVKNIMSDVTYTYENGHNVLKMILELPADENP